MIRNSTPPFSAPVISCLMVTQQGRLEETAQSIHCFVRQQQPRIELIIIHDCSDSYHQLLLELVSANLNSRIYIYQEAPGHTLGWLRNRSLVHAKADLVCQWDDDDYNHPERLKTQYEKMLNENTDFCFMTDQLHLFTEQSYLFWDDRSTLPAPLDLIENTMLGRRDLIGSYPDLRRSEDTAILEHIARQQYKVSRLSGAGWLYTYVFNGNNTWDFKHHSEISLHQRLGAKKLLAREMILREELQKYEFPFEQICMPHEKGKIDFKF